MTRNSHMTREGLLAAAREEDEAGNEALASLLTEEADHRPNSPAENAAVASDFPGGLRKES